MLPYALRSLRRDPALVAGVLLTFALAIGANAGMFGLVSRLMLPAPPGVDRPERVGRLRLHFQARDGERFTASTTAYPIFASVRRLTDAFAVVAAVGPTTSMIIGRGADAREVRTVAASGDYFAALGARAFRGRFFAADDDRLPAGEAVAVLGYAFWRSRFAGDTEAIGQTIVLDDRPFTIVGIAPPSFTGDGIKPVDVFVPLSAAMATDPSGWASDPTRNFVSVVARLREGVAPAVAAGAAAGAARAQREDLTSIAFEPLLPHAARSSPQARTAKWLFGVSLVVLIIAVANVGVLLLLRALHKRRDLAVRVALGASRRHLATQLVVESTLLAIAGGALGLLVSRWFSDIARVTLMPDLAASDSFVDGRVLALTAVLVIAAGLLAGMVPLALVAQRRITAVLGASTFGSPNRSRTQRALVGVQVALCTVLLVGAGLFVRSLQRIQGQDLGFSTAKLLFVQLEFREALPGVQRDELHEEAVRRLGTVRGVAAATVVQAIPFGPHHVPPISVPGLAGPPTAGGQLPIMYGATPEYLTLLGVSLLQGRLFTAQDRRGSELVVLVNETMAREVWPGGSALGKCIRIGFDPDQEPTPLAPATLPCRQVVGVVRDSRARSLRPVGREATLMQYYVPFGQLPPTMAPDPHATSGILVGVTGEAERMAPVVQRLVQGTSASPVYARVRPYQDLLDPQLRPWRLGATLFVVFGALALGIASVGLFGVVSYLVSQRTREIGVRLALGGTGGRVGRWVIGGAVRMVGIGCAVGLVVAAIAGPSAREMLFETSPYDVGIMVLACGILVLVTVVAATVPALRAARVSPTVAMRAD
jgi:predicted permease